MGEERANADPVPRLLLLFPGRSDLRIRIVPDCSCARSPVTGYLLTLTLLIYENAACLV
jgi:hypothetical protein